MAAYIVDTNVLAIAEAPTHQAGSRCHKKCSELLIQIQKDGTICIDNHRLILKEYLHYFSRSQKQPRIGRAFVKWLFDNVSIPEVEVVVVTPTDKKKTVFKEFPNDSSLKKFHVNDRKFVAVAKAKIGNPRASIVHATDKGWQNFEGALRRNGVEIIHLCP